MWVRFLDQEDALEEEMATHFGILAWRISWTEKPDELQSIGHKEQDTAEHMCMQKTKSKQAKNGSI